MIHLIIVTTVFYVFVFFMTLSCITGLAVVNQSGVNGTIFGRSPVHLTWAVRLNEETVASSHVHLAADIVALSVGLVNLGQVGQLDYYYAMTYNSLCGSPLPTAVGSHNNSFPSQFFTVKHMTVVQSNESVLCGENVSDIIQQTDWKLRRHVFVSWFSQQKSVFRNNRHLNSRSIQKSSSDGSRLQKLNFNDPMFPKQWHLVSLTFFFAKLVPSFEIFV